MKIMPNRMDRGFDAYQAEFEAKAIEVLRSGWYILGKELTSFEKEFSEEIESDHTIGLASGLDALWIALRILGIGSGDEVIVQANTYIASVMGITINGATPVFVEPDEFYNIDASKIEQAITERTKAIMVVHLYGQPAQMDQIMKLAHKYHLRVVEDCAQSHGARFNGKMTGTFGDFGCFSFYPSKNLGAFGDAGALCTSDPDLAEQVRVFRNYGSEKRYYNKVVGTNSRLDELQAGLLRVKLKHLTEINIERTELCERYLHEINSTYLQLPKIHPQAESVWHQFVIQTAYRDELISYLNALEIGTIIHYPIPPHLSEAYNYLGHKTGDFPIAEQLANHVLSLPLYNGMLKGEQDYVIKAINQFRGKND